MTTPLSVTPIAPSATHPGVAAAMGSDDSEKVKLRAPGIPGFGSMAVSTLYEVIGQLPILRSTGKSFAWIVRVPPEFDIENEPAAGAKLHVGSHGFFRMFQVPAEVLI